jgi:hypothetical protein
VACTARTPRKRSAAAQAVSTMDTGGVGDMGPDGLPRANGRSGGLDQVGGEEEFGEQRRTSGVGPQRRMGCWLRRCR